MKDFKDEYKYFIKRYLLPLLGISQQNPNLIPVSGTLSTGAYFEQNGGNLCFYSSNKEIVFKMPYTQPVTKENIALARSIIPAFFNISSYDSSSRRKNIYQSKHHRDSNYEMAIERGICNWITGGKNDKIENLFGILENWSVKTYEGKKVTLGLVINPTAKQVFSSNYGSWEDFLKDDFVAVLTDSINSVIEMDEKCNFVRYLSVTEGAKVDAYSLNNQLPLRFANTIQKYTQGNCVGIFLLNNGDIILSKNQKICLVKRNLHWLNFSYEAFSNAISTTTISLSNKLIESIYASMLDVSFAHTGGIIAVVKDIDKLSEYEKDDFPILSPFDRINNNKLSNVVETEIKAKNAVYSKSGKKHLVIKTEEIKKRLLKRDILLKLINGSNFINLDRKLKCELISLDGACIINTEGEICACGAIIKNDSGSSGGGRGAASKKLSFYGLAIKISTDGYIELYVDEKLKYSIK